LETYVTRAVLVFDDISSVNQNLYCRLTDKLWYKCVHYVKTLTLFQLFLSLYKLLSRYSE